MYDEVARLHFLQFLHRQCHLSGPCSVRLEVVFMETVEYLVVRKEAQTEVGVGESLVQSVVNGRERDVVSYGESLRIGRFLMAGVAYSTQFVALENLLQSACLLLAVRKNIKTIALKQEVFESLSQ